LAESLVSRLSGTVGRGHPIEKIELVPSGGGVFDVFVDDKRLFSKADAHRFPEAKEILDLLPSK
jgi:selenoprotein W-related protein